jgi:hypothetical protein
VRGVYGFGVFHAHAVLIDVAGNGLTIFIVYPSRTDVLDRRGLTMHIKPLIDELMGALQSSNVGASRGRPSAMTP